MAQKRIGVINVHGFSCFDGSQGPNRHKSAIGADGVPTIGHAVMS